MGCCDNPVLEKGFSNQFENHFEIDKRRENTNYWGVFASGI